MLASGSLRSVDLYKPEDSEPGHMHFMVYSFGEPIALSEALPLLEDMGVDVYTEHPSEAKLQTGGPEDSGCPLSCEQGPGLRRETIRHADRY